MCSAKELKSHPGTKLLISEGAVISSRGDTMRRPGAMELWSPPRRDNHLIKMGLLFPRHSIVVWTSLIYNYMQWESYPDCSTPIAWGLSLPLLSGPALGQLCGPLTTWEHRRDLKEWRWSVHSGPHIWAPHIQPLWDLSEGAGPRQSPIKPGCSQPSNMCMYQKAKDHHTEMPHHAQYLLILGQSEAQTRTNSPGQWQTSPLWMCFTSFSILILNGTVFARLLSHYCLCICLLCLVSVITQSILKS